MVQINEGPIGPILEALRTPLNPWLGEPRWKANQGRATLIYRFESEIPPVTSMGSNDHRSSFFNFCVH